MNAYSALTNTTPPPNPNDPANWKSEPISVESEHPYKPNTTQDFVVTVPNAKKIAVYFDRFEVEKIFSGIAYDWVEFFDSKGKSLGKWSGHHNKEFSPIAEGDTIRMQLKTDKDVQEFGFVSTSAAVLY